MLIGCSSLYFAFVFCLNHSPFLYISQDKMTCINCRENRDRFQNSSNLNSNRVTKKSKPSTENSDDVIAFAPDGGYAWVILACSFYSSFCMEGLIASFGLLLPSLMREFKASAAVVSILNSTLIGIFLVLGLLRDIPWKISLRNVLKYWLIKIHVFQFWY